MKTTLCIITLAFALFSCQNEETLRLQMENQILKSKVDSLTHLTNNIESQVILIP